MNVTNTTLRTERGGNSLWKDAFRRLRRNPLVVLSFGVVVVFTLAAIYGSVVHWRYRILDAEMPARLQPVKQLAIRILRAESVRGQEPVYIRQDLDQRYQPPSRRHLMGTDGLGRDVFHRLVQGTRIAFQVGVITSLIAIPIGVILGCLAGYFGKRVDDVIVWLYSTFDCMPSLLFIIAIAMIARKGLMGVYLGIGLTSWVHLCRLMRGEVLKHRQLGYVQAARALGAGPFRILFIHILPNLMHLVIINFSIRFPAAVQTEVIMSFLGIGVQDEPSWGIMISNARLRLWEGIWWELGFTTLIILVVVLAFNLLGDALRDALDPRLRVTGDHD